MVDCGLTNLATCLPEKFFEYLLSIISAPLQQLLDLNRTLLSEPVNVNLFAPIWVIVIYVISMFYAFLIMYSGFTFIISGYDSAKRENAKQWLRNTVIMIVLVQASFFIYELITNLSAVIASSTLTLVPQEFFNLTIDNIPDFALQITFGILYLLTLITSLLFLVLRYAIVAIGTVMFPLAIFFYFIPPLRSYGLLALNFLGTAIFITALDALILVGFGRLIELDTFSNLKILVMIAAFGVIILLMFFLMFFSVIKAGVGAYNKIGGLVAAFAA